MQHALRGGRFADSKTSWPLFDKKRSLQRDQTTVQRWQELIQWYKYTPSLSWKVSIIEFYFQTSYPIITPVKVSGQKSRPEWVIGDLTRELLCVSFSSLSLTMSIPRDFKGKGKNPIADSYEINDPLKKIISLQRKERKVSEGKKLSLNLLS